MTNYTVIWERDGLKGFDFVNAEDETDAIELWIDSQSGPHPGGCLSKMIITETSNTCEIPLDLYGYHFEEVDK